MNSRAIAGRKQFAHPGFDYSKTESMSPFLFGKADVQNRVAIFLKIKTDLPAGRTFPRLQL